MSDVCTRVAGTLEVPFIQRNRIHLSPKKEIFSDRTFLIVNTEVLRHCHHCWKFTQVQCTLLEYTLFILLRSPPFFVDWLYVHCYYYLLRHTLHHSAPPISRIDSALDSKRSKTGDPPSELYVSKGAATVHAVRTSTWSRVSTWPTLIKLTICNGSGLPVQKLLSLSTAFGASKIFSFHCPL